VRPDAHRLSPTSQIGLYPGEDIASYTVYIVLNSLGT